MSNIGKCERCRSSFLIESTSGHNRRFCHTCFMVDARKNAKRIAHKSKNIGDQPIQLQSGEDQRIEIPETSIRSRSYAPVKGSLAIINVLDSNFSCEGLGFTNDQFIFTGRHGSYTKIPITEVIGFQVLDEEQVKKFVGSAALAVAGGLALGIAGVAAGALTGGNSKKVTFRLEFRGDLVVVGQARSDFANRIKAFLTVHKPSGDTKLIGEPPVQRGNTYFELVKLIWLLLFIGVSSAVLFASALLMM